MIFKKIKDSGDDSATRRVSGEGATGWHGATQKLSSASQELTQLLNSQGETANMLKAPAQDKTVVHRPGADKPAAALPLTAEELPVGWLIVVEGPGKGAARQLGYGHNGIGRDADQRVPLDLGDAMISRRRHAAVTYDGKHRKFYLTHGEGDNLVYLRDAPVLEPKELKAHDRFTLGGTTLMLVPLCGDAFDWE